jgi:uncharacterized protein with GYD domain
MPTFVCSLRWTDQGVRSIKDALQRRSRARLVAGKLGITIKDIYITTGESDVLVIMDAPDGDAAAKFALAAGSQGNTRSSTCRAFTEAEFDKILKDLPDV